MADSTIGEKRTRASSSSLNSDTQATKIQVTDRDSQSSVENARPVHGQSVEDQNRLDDRHRSLPSWLRASGPTSKRVRVAAPRSAIRRLPEAVLSLIFLKIPPADVAASCALTCRQWRRVASDPFLWQVFCQGNGLTEEDAHLVLGGWRGLYERIFAPNLVGGPHFERIDHIDTERIKCARDDDPCPPFEPVHRICKERLFTSGETEEEPGARSFWALEGGGLVFHRGGSHRLVRRVVFGERDTLPWLPGVRGVEVEKHRVNYPGGGLIRSGGGDCSDGRSSSTVLCSFGKSFSTLQQSIGVKNFGCPFLGSCPPIEVSAWCSAVGEGEGSGNKSTRHVADSSNTESAGRAATPAEAGRGGGGGGGGGGNRSSSTTSSSSQFRMQLVLKDGSKQVLSTWDSGVVKPPHGKWIQVKGTISAYPKGLQHISVRLAAADVQLTAISARFIARNCC